MAIVFQSMRVIGAAAFFAIMAGAASADGYGAPRRPVPVKLTVSNWTGFYGGLNAGYGRGGGIDNTLSPSTCTFPAAACPLIFAAEQAALPGQFDTHPKGFIGGWQLGYNHKTGPFVLGIETDFQW